jgi:hypothetical protein
VDVPEGVLAGSHASVQRTGVGPCGYDEIVAPLRTLGSAPDSVRQFRPQRNNDAFGVVADERLRRGERSGQ